MLNSLSYWAVVVFPAVLFEPILCQDLIVNTIYICDGGI